MGADTPIPPEPSRQDALGRLRRERWHAQNAGELGRVAEIDREIERLSAASTPVPPARETTSATPPTRERRATPPRKKTTMSLADSVLAALKGFTDEVSSWTNQGSLVSIAGHIATIENAAAQDVHAGETAAKTVLAELYGAFHGHTTEPLAPAAPVAAPAPVVAEPTPVAVAPAPAEPVATPVAADPTPAPSTTVEASSAPSSTPSTSATDTPAAAV